MRRTKTTMQRHEARPSIVHTFSYDILLRFLLLLVYVIPVLSVNHAAQQRTSVVTSRPASSASSAAAAAVTAASNTTTSPSSSSSNTTSPIPQVDLPTPLTATWIQISNVVGDPVFGVPEPRCDHIMRSLQRNIYRNDDPSDVYRGIAWIHGGHGASSLSFNDSWLLDINTDPPRWTKLNYSSGSDFPVRSRWGMAVSFLAQGLDPRDKGLTAVIFGGSDAVTNFDDMVTLNFANNVMRQIQPLSDDMLGGGGPFARAYLELNILPKGYGTNTSVINASDSGCFITVGGSGSSNGERGSVFDHTVQDYWIWNSTAPASSRWSRFGPYTCLANLTQCSDSKPLYQYNAPLTGVYNSSALNLTTTYRPAEAYPALKQFLSTVGTLNGTLSKSLSGLSGSSSQFQNKPNACTTVCTNEIVASTDDNPFPPEIEGYTTATLDGKMYLFGGYMCSEYGIQRRGGDACFLQNLWILDQSTMKWSAVPRPDPNGPYAQYVPYYPSARSYVVMNADVSRKIIIIQGGAFQDLGSTFFYYNDVFAFDTVLGLFVPITATGVPPNKLWSATSFIQGSSVYVFGGCSGDTYTNDLVVLKLGLTLDASNAFAYGLTSAVAGSQQTFYIQMRESTKVDINSARYNASSEQTRLNGNSSIVWGKPATYGEGLTFFAQLVTQEAVRDSGSQVILGKVREHGAGNYSISFTAFYGTQYKVYVYLADEIIPGFPFAVSLTPNNHAVASMSTCAGFGIEVGVKGDSGSVMVQLRDQFGNAFSDTRFLKGPTANQVFVADSWTASDGSPFKFTATITPPTPDLPAYAVPLYVQNNLDGTFNLSYGIPTNFNSYSLKIFLSGNLTSGTSYQVESLTPLQLQLGWKIAFYTLSGVIIVICLILSQQVRYHRSSVAIRSSSPNFLHLLILGSILCSLSVVFLGMEGNSYACQGFHCFLSIGLVVSMSALLAKSHRVMRIFTASKLRIQNNLNDRNLFIPTFFAIALMVCINVAWVAIDPIMSVRIPSANNPEIQSFSSCQGDRIPMWLGMVLSYAGVILVYGVFLAIKTGNVPEQFNESKLIAASVYNIFFCAVIVVPLLFFIGDSSDFITGRMVIQSTVILWCAAFNVLSIIGPKLLIQIRFMRMGGDKGVSTVAVKSSLMSSTSHGKSQARINTNGVDQTTSPPGKKHSETPPSQPGVNRRPSPAPGANDRRPSPPMPRFVNNSTAPAPRFPSHQHHRSKSNQRTGLLDERENVSNVPVFLPNRTPSPAVAPGGRPTLTRAVTEMSPLRSPSAQDSSGAVAVTDVSVEGVSPTPVVADVTIHMAPVEETPKAAIAPSPPSLSGHVTVETVLRGTESASDFVGRLHERLLTSPRASPSTRSQASSPMPGSSPSTAAAVAGAASAETENSSIMMSSAAMSIDGEMLVSTPLRPLLPSNLSASEVSKRLRELRMKGYGAHTGRRDTTTPTVDETKPDTIAANAAATQAALIEAAATESRVSL